MSLRTKLTVGLGFLFIIIFGLVAYSTVEIKQLSKASDNILKDNYASLVYCKKMLLSLDDMCTAISGRILSASQNGDDSYDKRLFESGQSTFDRNLRAEEINITEIQESEYVAELQKAYSLFLGLSKRIAEKGGSLTLYFGSFLPAAMETRALIVRIDDINMQAVERKSQATQHTAGQMMISMGVVGTIGIILAFFYFWYFPFFVTTSISYLAKRMKDLLQGAGIKSDSATKDETLILLHSINLLENKIPGAKKGTKRKV